MSNETVKTEIVSIKEGLRAGDKLHISAIRVKPRQFYDEDSKTQKESVVMYIKGKLNGTDTVLSANSVTVVYSNLRQYLIEKDLIDDDTTDELIADLNLDLTVEMIKSGKSKFSYAQFVELSHPDINTLF